MSRQMVDADRKASHDIRAAVIAVRGTDPRLDLSGCGFVSRELADRYRSARGYVDETNAQIAAAVGMTDRQVRRRLAVLEDAGVWLVSRRGTRQGGGTRRHPGPVLLAHLDGGEGVTRETPGVSVAEDPQPPIDGSTTATTVVAVVEGFTTDRKALTTDRKSLTTATTVVAVPHYVTPLRPPANLSTERSSTDPTSSGAEGNRKGPGEPDNDPPDDTEPFSITTTTGDDALNNMSDLFGAAAQRAAQADEAGRGTPVSPFTTRMRLKDVTTDAHRALVRDWLARGATPSQAADAIAERVRRHGNPIAAPRDLRPPLGSTRCGECCRDMRPNYACPLRSPDEERCIRSARYIDYSARAEQTA
jgi:DNA-binding transcriptional ArsR family regulator